MPKNRRRFGGIRKRASGRWQAWYTSPLAGDLTKYRAPFTFDTRDDAEAWLTSVRRQISAGDWTPEGTRQRAPLTFTEYADTWLERRALKPRTRAHYRSLIDAHIAPTFGARPLRGIDSMTVGEWHHAFGDDRPTTRAHAYGLLRSIFASAVQDQLIEHNPCHIRGAGTTKRRHKINPASPAELVAIIETMRPEQHRAMVLLAAWCALRFGELAELRRKDVDLTNQVIHVRRAVVRVDGKPMITTPKTDAGVRDVAIPPHVVPVLREHIKAHAQWGRDGLLFASAGGDHLAPSTFYGRVSTPTRAGYGFYEARAAAGRPDLRFHDLRHTGAVLAAQTGATLADLMNRLGHTTPAAAMRYQHATQNADRRIADALSRLALGES